MDGETLVDRSNAPHNSGAGQTGCRANLLDRSMNERSGERADASISRTPFRQDRGDRLEFGRALFWFRRATHRKLDLPGAR